MGYGDRDDASSRGSQRSTNSVSRSQKGGSPSPLLRKARVLGFETRNVSNEWLQPLGLRNTPDPPLASPGGDNAHGSPGRASRSPGPASPTGFHYSTSRDFVPLSPHYGPGQNTPKELACLRTTKSLQHLGRTAIFSQNPYVDSALETLLPATISNLGSLSPNSSQRRLTGKLPRKGAKAAAMQRARMLVSLGASFKSEVPFADAVRVCNLAGDKTAMPALLDAYIFSKPKLQLSKLEYYSDVLSMQPPLIQLQSVAQLLQAGFYFTAIKVVYGDVELLKATLEEMQLLVSLGKEDLDWEVSAQTWSWQDLDKELFVKQFHELKVIAYYMDVRKQLRAMKAQGAVALARVEREMLSKVVSDFMAQVDSEFRAQKEEQAAALQARQAEEEQRKAEEERKLAAKLAAMEEAKARAAAKAKAMAEERKRAAEERAKSYAEAKRAEREARGQGEGLGSEASQGPSEGALEEAALLLLKAAQEEHEALSDGQKESAGGALTEEHSLVQPEASFGRHDELAEPNCPEPSASALPPGPPPAPAPAPAPAPERTPKKPASHPPKPPPRQGSPSASKPAPQPPAELPRQDSAIRATEAAAAAAADLAAELALSMTDEDVEARAIASTIVSQALARAVSASAAAGAAAQIAANAIAKVLNAALDSKAGSRAASPYNGAPSSTAPSGIPPRPPSGALPLSKTPSRLGTPILLSQPTGAPPAGLLRSPLGSRPSSFRRDGEPELGLSAADIAGLMSPAGSRPTTAGSVISREGLDAGIAEMRRQLSEGRKMMEVAAEQLRASRPTTPAKAITALAGESLVQGLEDALGAQSRRQEAERQDLAAVLSGAATPQKDPKELLEQQQQLLEAQLQEKLALVGELHSEREILRSAQSVRPGSSQRALEQAAAEDDKKLKEVEIQLAAEELAARRLAEQKAVIEEERRRLEKEKDELRAESKAAMNEQITRTMRMFQEQLAQTVKMAAMLQAQRIMTGGVGPSMAAVAPAINLPHEVDEPPTQEEITEYARYLGMDPEADPDLLYIAEWALTAPVPEGWTVHLDSEGHEFFHNNVTNQSTYEHPMDEHYRKFYEQKRADKAAGGA